MPSSSEADGRLARLLRLLEDDADNLSLLTETAATALEEHQPHLAREMLERYAALAPLPPKEISLAGLAALQLNDFAEAAVLFERLHAQNPNNVALRFNLAWSLAMRKDAAGALDLLDEPTVAAIPQAAMLHVQILHDQGAFEEAEKSARNHIERHPDHGGLMAAVSVLAIDLEDTQLARVCAQRAGDHPDALATLGTLALSEDRDEEAQIFFARALEHNPGNARALIGRGLISMLEGAPTEAAADLERGAMIFDSHVGSWIATGWALLLGGDLADAEHKFARALALDRNFAEAHGSLAVVYLMQGRADEARRAIDTAIRLDGRSFSGALAQSMMLTSDGKPELSRKVIERALNTPIDATGRTIAQSLAKHTLTR